MQQPTIRAHGFGLLETIIALAVVAVALMAVMQSLSQSLRSNASATHLLHATSFATELMERIRVNAYQHATNYNTATEIPCTTAPKRCIGVSSTCNGAEMAAFDLHDLSCGFDGSGNPSSNIKRKLPQGGYGIVCLQQTASAHCEITVSWQGVSDDAERQIALRSVIARQ